MRVSKVDAETGEIAGFWKRLGWGVFGKRYAQMTIEDLENALSQDISDIEAAASDSELWGVIGGDGVVAHKNFLEKYIEDRKVGTAKKRYTCDARGECVGSKS